MNKTANRKYVSPSRRRQAEATRNRILDAAETLLTRKGYDGMTIAEVAELANVSPQTVYAVFTSKAGIITAAIEDRVLNDDRNVDTIKRLQTSTDPAVTLRSAAKLIRNIYEGNAPTFAAVYGTTMVSPKLAELTAELSELRFEKQKPIVAILMASGRVQPGLDEAAVSDILWMLTARELYYLLVIRRGWSPERYEAQLVSMLCSALLTPES